MEGLREYCGYDKVRVQSVAELTKMTLQAGIFTASCVAFPLGQ
jgi:hypothetical protein